ncbi:MAG: hypothetical protein AB1714_26745 [Acidobacteriota bacterium]
MASAWNAVFLISRQPRCVTPQTPWLCAVRSVARWAIDREFTLVCGSGQTPLDFGRWCYADLGGRVIEMGDASVHDAASMRERDRAVAGAGEVLVAVAVRGGGIMEEEGLRALSEGKSVWAVPPLAGGRAYAGNRRLLEQGASLLDIDIPVPVAQPDANFSELRECSADPLGYVWHYTRAHPGPWPGQSQHQYFRSLADNLPGASHSARDALRRILDERFIRASSHGIRGGHAVVCFSAADPVALLSRRSYRSSLKGWDFEPYAIGIDKTAAECVGLRPVQYLAEDQYDALPQSQRAFFQKHQTGSADWTHESEWRHLGDMDLTAIPLDRVSALLPEAGSGESVSQAAFSIRSFACL